MKSQEWERERDLDADVGENSYRGKVKKEGGSGEFEEEERKEELSIHWGRAREGGVWKAETG